MLNAQTLSYLSSPAGQELIAEAAAAEGELLARLTRLRRRHPPELAAAAVELLALRARAAAKFPGAAGMYFTREGLEQSTGHTAAEWRAARYPQGATIIDLCSGIGGDSIALAGRGRVLAVDADPAMTVCVRANSHACGVEDNVSTTEADVTRLALAGDAALFDPSRRLRGKRVRNPESYQPPLSFTSEILGHVPNLAVKVSPVLPDDVLASLGGRIEFVSVYGECREAVAWFGGIGPEAAVQASILPAGATLARFPDRCPPTIGPLGAWLLDPDPAIVRAHLLPELAEIAAARLVNEDSAYLTSDTNPATPFARAYRIVAVHPSTPKHLRQWLRQGNRYVYAVKRREVQIDPDDVSRAVPREGDTPSVVVLVRVARRVAAVVCEMPARMDASEIP